MNSRIRKTGALPRVNDVLRWMKSDLQNAGDQHSRADEWTREGIVPDHRRPLFWSHGDRASCRHFVPTMDGQTPTEPGTAVNIGSSISAAIFHHAAPES
jgi:hypothetical protein